MDGDEEGGIKKEEDKGKFLILLSALNFGDQEALQIAQERKILDPKDLASLENENPENYQDGATAEVDENGQIIPGTNDENDNDKTSIVDWAIAGGVVASVSAVGLYALRKIFKRHWRAYNIIILFFSYKI